MTYRLFVFLVLAMLANGQTDSLTPEPLREVGIDQRLDQQLPLDVELTDETGAVRPLREYFSGRPVVLALVYYECPMLCNMTLNGLLRAARVIPLDIGKDYDVLTISFDSKETPQQAAAKKDEYVRRYKRPHAERGWRFLTGSQTSIRRLTEAAGFRYRFDPDSKQWAHASAIMTVTPEGKFSRYFYGVEYSARDLRFGLVEASQGKIGSKVEQFLLYCFHYDPKTGKYSVAVMRIVRTAGAATLLTILGFWFLMYRQSRRRTGFSLSSADGRTAR
jgi:protein SCO1/2